MTIRLLTRNRKKFNSTFIVSFSAFAICWLIIFPTIIFGKSDSMFIVTLILTSGILLLVSILSALLNTIFVKRIELSNYKKISLLVNADLREQEIRKKSDINYAQNFILADIHKYEIDNNQTYNLLCSKVIENIEIKQQKTRILEFSPKEFFNTIMDMLWAAS